MIRWITKHLGTAAFNKITESDDIHILDIRDLVDKSGNTSKAIKSKIDEALDYLNRGKRVAICCDLGISRSNAIAAGVLAIKDNIRLEEAIRLVLSATGEKAIKIEVLSAVRKALTQKEKVFSNKDQPFDLLVTGASGFIGSSLIEELRKNYKILAPTRHDLDLVHDAVELDLLIKEKQIKTILHLANPRTYTNNESLGESLVMLKNVLDVCVENRLYLVYLSGWEIYSGYKSRQLIANETLPPLPKGTYGYTKFLCETLIENYHRQYEIPYTILRASPVYGSHSGPRFIWNFLRKALQNKEIVTHKYINDYPILDLLHIDDLRRAVTLSLERRVQGAINIGTGIGTTTAEVAKRIVKMVDSQSKILHLEIEEYTSNIIMDIGRASVTLGWHPKVDLEEGLQSIIKYEMNKLDPNIRKIQNIKD